MHSCWDSVSDVTVIIALQEPWSRIIFYNQKKVPENITNSCTEQNVSSRTKYGKIKVFLWLYTSEISWIEYYHNKHSCKFILRCRPQFRFHSGKFLWPRPVSSQLLADLKGAPGTPPLGSKFFHFHAVFSK